MKSLISLVVAGLVTISMTGCGEQPKPEKPKQKEFDNRCKINGELAPKWTCTPFVDGAIAELGTARKTQAGYGFQRRNALANGRSNLAQQIETLVKDKVENFARTTGGADNETVDQVATQVSKQVAKVTLRGSKQINSWTASDGTMYVLVAVPQKVVNESAKESVKTSYKNDNALWQQFQSKQAMESLEKEFPTN